MPQPPTQRQSQAAQGRNYKHFMDVLTIAFMSLQGMNDGTKMVMDASGNGAGKGRGGRPGY